VPEAAAAATTADCENGAGAFVRTLHEHGVDTMFGLPGSTEAALLEAVRRDGNLRYILALHETIVVAMAEGYARASGRVGVIGLHTSVGTMNGLSQIYNAHRHGSAIAVMACHKDRATLAVDGFCAVPDLPALARGFTKLAAESRSAALIAGDLHRALHVAQASPPGPTFLSIPEDLLAESLPSIAPVRPKPVRAGTLQRSPDEAGVRAAIDLLTAAARPILVLGSDAAGAVAEARALAEALELPVFSAERSQLAEIPYPVRDPRSFAQYGEHPALVAGADCVVAIGMRVFHPFSVGQQVRLPVNARLIHAHPDPNYVGWETEPDVGLSGDAAPVLRMLREEALRRGLSADVRAARVARLAELRAAFADALAADRERNSAADGRHSLIDVADVLGELLEEDALVFDEAISSSVVLLRHCRFPDRARILRNAGGSLGWALPAAVGAKIAQPRRQVVAVIGDGSFHFAPQALWTAARENAPIGVLAVDNGGYLSVKVSIERQLQRGKDERRHPGTSLPSLDHAATARSYGADAVTLDPGSLDLRSSLAWALGRAERSRVLTIPVPDVR
jgi:benzoylformate decarboxylase